MSFTTKSVLLALGSSNSDSIDENSKNHILIKVPQKCYAFITPDTPKEIKGLYTEGLYSCSGVSLVAKNDTQSHIFLCHADTLTNLLDEAHGIPGWIKKSPSFLDDVTIYYDDVEDDFYKRLLEPALQQMNKLGANVRLVPSDNEIRDIVIFRDRPFNRRDTIDKYQVVDDTPKEQSDFVQHVSYLVYEHQFIEPHPPICVFDANDMLSVNEIFIRQPWIKDIIEPSKEHTLTIDSGDEKRFSNKKSS